MRSKLRATLAGTAAAALVLGTSGLALADTVVVSPDVTRAPGETATFVVGLVVDDNNVDPLNGCNANPQNPVTVQFSSGNSDVVAAPVSVQLTGCDNSATPNVVEDAATVTYRVSASAKNGDTATITASASGGRQGGGNPKVYGTFNPDSITISVATPLPSDSTAPVITPIVTGTLGQNGWYTSDVTVTWSVSDDEGPITSSTGCGPTTVSTDTAGQTLTCTATSAGGTSTNSVTIKRDATAPTVRCAEADGAWHADNVSLGCTASDGGSGIAEADKTFSLATSVAGGEETSNASTGSRTVTDAAGNSASAGPIAGNKIDRKAPEVSCGSDDGSWHAGNVAIACTAKDGGSGLANSGDAAFTLSTNVAAGDETGSASTGSRQVADAVGNTTTVDAVTGIKVDRKAPVVTCAPVDDKWHKNDVVLACTAVDNGSGVADGDASFTLSTSVVDGEETGNAATDSREVSDKVGNSVTVGPFTGNKVDKKAPQISCGSDDGTWHNANVDIACTAKDGGSGLANNADISFNLSTTVAAGEETDNASTGSHDVSDAVGNASTAGPISRIKVDRKAPQVSCDPVDDIWHNGDVTLVCTAVDNGSGVADSDASFTLSTNVAEGEETDEASTGSRVVSDAVGNEVTVGPFTGIKVDRKAPEVSCDPDDGTWHKANVTLTCKASDLGSGLANAADAIFTLSTTVADGEETDNASTGSHEVADALGHTSVAGPISGIKVDRKSPTITWSAGAGSDFYFGDQVTAPTCTAADGGSGVNGGCTVSGFSTAVGTHTVTATATDKVGNVGTSSLTYTVRAWTLDGFYKPVDMGGVVNTVKAGSTVPLKFNVFKGSERLTSNIGATFSAKKVTCGSTPVTDAIEEFTTTGSTSLRYDTTSQQWIQNWATPKSGAGSCYRVTMTTADGTTISADFKLK